MAYSRLVFTVLLISVSCYANYVPAYLWGDLESVSTASNPLEFTSAEEFAEIFKRELKNDPCTVIFIEENLSTEDISSKNNGKTTYPFLESNLGQSKYLPSVENPLKSIEFVADGEEADQIQVTENGLSAELEPGRNKYIFVNLKDAREGESRSEMLSRHNDIISDIYQKLKAGDRKVIGVYTGRYPSWTVTESHLRQRRQAQAGNDTNDDFILDSVRLYVERLELREGNNLLNLTNSPTSTSVFNSTTNIMNTTVNFGDHSFVMNFRIQGGYWFFDSIVFAQGTANEEDLFPSEELFSILGFSYRCGQRTSFTGVNATRTLVFNNLQIQPFFTPINETVVFGDAFDCVGFFSGPIWAGLLVTFIILIITFYGIIMMMDIKTMDRFDDPKGKTITINAAE